MRHWKILQQNENDVAALCKALNCSRFLARVLINRGIDTVEKAKDFLNIRASALYDPFLFRNMQKIVSRIGSAIRNQERITVYGDYDVDGITATGLLFEALKDMGGYVDYYIPSRFTEGYGVNDAAVRLIAERGTKLIITVDTGITAVAETELAKELGVDVIVTDHHECQSVLPDTLILNPKCPDSGYPFTELAGVGVVYKLICALDVELGLPGGAERFMPFAAIGTIADIMPMKSENRYIVGRGLELLPEIQCMGLRCLMERCVGDRAVDTSTVGFVIAPRINAAGRMGSAQIGVDLLTTEDQQRAEELVDELCRENNNRQSTENKILEQAVAMIENDPANQRRNAIVLWHEDWHNGVIGIVASRLKDRYGKPCILFTVNGEFAKGSGRSVRPFNLFEALERLSGELERFGGHAFAAGVLARADNLERFRDLFCQEVDRFLEKDVFDESIEVDCLVDPEDLTVHKIQTLDQLAPYGRGNETPVFCMRNVDILDVIPTANGNHIRLALRCGKMRVTAFYFNVSSADFCYGPGDRVDLVFETDINTYNGRQSVRLLIRDVHYNQTTVQPLDLELQRLKAGEIRSDDVPAREDTVALYRYLLKQSAAGAKNLDFYTLPNKIEADMGRKMSLGAVYYSMRILRELGIVEYRHSGPIVSDVQIFNEKRVRLEDSVILNEIRKKAGEVG